MKSRLNFLVYFFLTCDGMIVGLLTVRSGSVRMAKLRRLSMFHRSFFLLATTSTSLYMFTSLCIVIPVVRDINGLVSKAVRRFLPNPSHRHEAQVVMFLLPILVVLLPILHFLLL